MKAPNLNLPPEITSLSEEAIRAILRDGSDSSGAGAIIGSIIQDYTEVYQRECHLQRKVLKFLPFPRPTGSNAEKIAFDLVEEEIASRLKSLNSKEKKS